MRRSGWFERRLLIALVLFSLVPTLLLVGLGTLLLRETVSLQTTPAGWERLGETGRDLLDRAEQSNDSALVAAAGRYRAELTESVQQAQRWGYQNRRLLRVLPWMALVFVTGLGLLGLRGARRIARQLSNPTKELVDWAGRIGRGEPLPAAPPNGTDTAGEFAVLRDSFRAMARELESSRAVEMENERARASIGLARGVAHELKNALTPLRLAIRTLNPRTQDERESIEVIEAESQRLDELARAFSQFGRPPEGVPSEIDVAELLEYLVRTHLPPHVERDLTVPENLPPVHGHYDSLSRAFANLLLNAVEALGPDGGMVSIAVDRLTGGDLEVRIGDTGTGLPAGAETRIWDPDFTTKSQGTGLGLALVKQTIQAHDGRISAGRREGGGAEFRVVLPVRGDPRHAVRPEPGELIAGRST